MVYIILEVAALTLDTDDLFFAVTYLSFHQLLLIFLPKVFNGVSDYAI
jgi:hypothetical protein